CARRPGPSPRRTRRASLRSSPRNRPGASTRRPTFRCRWTPTAICARGPIATESTGSRPSGCAARDIRMAVRIAPSILSADFGVLAEEIARVEAAGADQIHIDVMDGRFVPNISMGFPILDAIRKRTRLPLDLHLMIVEPEKYLAEFAARGADLLTVHVEACPHLQRTLVSIRELAARRGAPVRAGAALNPATHPSTLDYVTDDLDLVLVMSVNPGFGCQMLITD